MTHWNRSIDIKQHIGTETNNDAIVQAAHGIRAELGKIGFEDMDWTFDDLKIAFEDMACSSHDPEDNESLLEEFNATLDELYDWADDNRVWLGL